MADRASDANMLTGFVYCGGCGGPLIYDRLVLRCEKSPGGLSCGTVSVEVAPAEALVVEAVVQCLMAPRPLMRSPALLLRAGSRR